MTVFCWCPAQASRRLAQPGGDDVQALDDVGDARPLLVASDHSPAGEGLQGGEGDVLTDAPTKQQTLGFTLGRDKGDPHPRAYGVGRASIFSTSPRTRIVPS